MQTKIFEALKQAYTHLGLGDDIFQALAATLNGTGLITDENLQSVISSQKTHLEALQAANDKRVTDARKKWQKEQDEANAKAKAEADRLAKENADKMAALQAQLAAAGKTPTDTSEWQKYFDEKMSTTTTQMQALQESIATMQKTNEEQAAKIRLMEDEKAKALAAKVKAERNAYIANKAKELGIPDYRINEGFAIADDADNTVIDNYLTEVSSHIKNQTLPFGSMGSIIKDGKITDEAADEILGNMGV